MVIFNKKAFFLPNWWGRKNAAPLKFFPNRRRRYFRPFFSNFDKYRLEVGAADDVISGVTVYWVGVNARVKLCDSTFWGRTVRLIAGWSHFTHSHADLIAVCSRAEVASHVISGRCMWLTIPHKRV